MAFTTGAAILEQENTSPTTVCTSGSALATDSFDSESKTVLSSDAPFAKLLLTFQVGATTGAGAFVNIYRRDMNVDGTTDTTIPSATNPKIYVGRILIPEGMTINTDYTETESAAPLDGDCEFYIENQMGVSINSGWVLKADTKSYNASV
ncbi:MAG: hypothetical protein DRQ62_13095 [Gammaproteobacteria bacterium]|nr:MAG: hypothetical protein DRQ62_13095 [Gammaproteobacteria bacterium]